MTTRSRIRPTWMALIGIVCLSLFSSASSVTLAQKADSATLEKDAPSAASKAPAGEWDYQLDFRHEGLLFTDVRVDGSAKGYNFLIDTGASMSILSLHLAKRLALPLQDSPMPAQGVGTQELKLASNVSLMAGGYEYKPTILGVLDTAHLGALTERRLDGILGCDFLYNFKNCHFDFEHSKLYLRPFAEGERPRTAADLQDSMEGVMEFLDRFRKVLDGEGDITEIIGELAKIIAKELERAANANDPKNDRKNEESKPSEKDSGKDAEKEKKPERFSNRISDSAFSPSVNYLDVPLPAIQKAVTAQSATNATSGPVATEIEFTMIDSDLPMIGKTVIGTLMFTSIKVNGQDTPVLFDTGAGATLVLDNRKARSLDVGDGVGITVSGVGSSQATMGIARSIQVGDYLDRRQHPTINMDLAALLEQLKNPIMQAIGVKEVSGEGIIGLPFCMQYRAMEIDFLNRNVKFHPYAKEQKESAGEKEEEDLMLRAIKSVWDGKAGAVDFSITPLDAIELLFEKLEAGAVVTSVETGGYAEAAGLERGDLILSAKMSGVSKDEFEPVHSSDELGIAAALAGAGATLELNVRRKATGKDELISIELGSYSGSYRIPDWYGK